MQERSVPAPNSFCSPDHLILKRSRRESILIPAIMTGVCSVVPILQLLVVHGPYDTETFVVHNRKCHFCCRLFHHVSTCTIIYFRNGTCHCNGRNDMIRKFEVTLTKLTRQVHCYKTLRYQVINTLHSPWTDATRRRQRAYSRAAFVKDETAQLSWQTRRVIGGVANHVLNKCYQKERSCEMWNPSERLTIHDCVLSPWW